MTNEDFDFEKWFDNLSLAVLDRCGIDFTDEESVREDYNRGRNLYDVADEISAEYGE